VRRWPFALFGTTVAWRIFARFVLASLIPVGVLAALFFNEVEGSLQRRTTEQLEDASRGVGQLVLDKLLAASNILTVVDAPDAITSVRSLGLSSLRYESNGTTVTFGDPFDPPPLPAHVDPMRPALLVSERPGDAAEIFIARPLPRGTAIGRLDTQYLRAAALLAGSSMETCVLAGSLHGAPVFCTGTAFRSMPDQPAGRSSGTVSWSNEREPWLAAYWELFTPSRFESQPWFVVVAMPRDSANESLSLFQRVAPQTLALSLVISILLAFSQIRRTLSPLKKLVAGTRRIAAQDFQTPVGVTGSDEFGLLGGALDTMAERLGRQFGTLTTLAAIDSLILSSDDIESVLEEALSRIAQMFDDADVSVLLTDTANDLRGRQYQRHTGAATQLTRVDLSSEQRAALLACGDGEMLDVETARLQQLDGFGAWKNGARVFVASITRGRALGGALFATLPATFSDERDFALLRELANRIAVAIAASEREKALFQRAHFDPLTGLPNRQLCHDRLSQAIAEARRDGGRLGVLFIDLDGFKNINDSLGHVAGDDVLRETGLRLSAAMRETDTVARLGGDEYVAILPCLETTLEIDVVAERVMTALRKPFVVQGRESVISGSIGVTVFPDDGTSAAELLRKADMAMYSAKASGRSCCRYFAKEMDLRLQERSALNSELHQAIKNGEFHLVYQPQVSTDGVRVIAAEALLRWRHPTRGLLSPELFVPILEETGLIESVGNWILHRALRDLAEWRRAGLALPRIAVNITARQLLASGLVANVDDALRRTGLGPENLELELTETSLVQDLGVANARLSELSARGVRVAVDDFGTGYSSLGYLNALTFDALKIDRTFVVNLPGEKSVAIVKAIVAVAHSLGKEVVAEGVESELQLMQLMKLRCDLAQGYLFSPPLEASAFAKWLQQRPLNSLTRRSTGVG